MLRERRIDLGTSNSAAAVLRGARPVTMPSASHLSVPRPRGSCAATGGGLCALSRGPGQHRSQVGWLRAAAGRAAPSARRLGSRVHRVLLGTTSSSHPSDERRPSVYVDGTARGCDIAPGGGPRAHAPSVPTASSSSPHGGNPDRHGALRRSGASSGASGPRLDGQRRGHAPPPPRPRRRRHHERSASVLRSVFARRGLALGGDDAHSLAVTGPVP